MITQVKSNCRTYEIRTKSSSEFERLEIFIRRQIEWSANSEKAKCKIEIWFWKVSERERVRARVCMCVYACACVGGRGATRSREVSFLFGKRPFESEFIEAFFLPWLRSVAFFLLLQGQPQGPNLQGRLFKNVKIRKKTKNWVPNGLALKAINASLAWLSRFLSQ